LETFSPADYRYWKEQGWLDEGAWYFTDHARGGFLKSIYPRFVAWLMGRGIDRQIAKLGGPESEGESGDGSG
jgi:hypothetical protein